MTERNSAPDEPFDVQATIARIADRTRDAIRDLGRSGAVVAVSGGVDSGVVAGLSVEALGAEHVLLLRLPEHSISAESTDLGRELAESLGAPSAEEPISEALSALGYETRRDEAIRKVFPDFEPDWRHKLVRSPPTGGIIVFSLVVERPGGEEESKRLPPGAYRELLAAQNLKQRVRKVFEYTYADRLGYAVIGTPNRLEYDQGFFVKGGDGLADLKPIASLYKTQVYALARELGLPEGIAGRAPTTETFSLPQSQEEFYFGHPHERMDMLLWGREHDVPADQLAERIGVEPDVVTAAYGEIDRRRVATRYLHESAVLVDGGP
jgi:NAD+ synthase